MDLTKIILDEKEISSIVTENVDTMPYVRGYHVCKTPCIPFIGECLFSHWEPDNPEDNKVK